MPSFRKNRWSGFRDQFVTHIRTYIRTKGDIIEAIAFAGKIIGHLQMEARFPW